MNEVTVMRCNECNVDLGESYHICPLCGAKAKDNPPHLSGIEEAPYPDVTSSVEAEWDADRPSKSVFRVTFLLAAAAAIFGKGVLCGFVAPCLLLFSAFYYFFAALREPGRLLHAGLSSLLTLIASAILLIVTILRPVPVWPTLFLCVFAATFFAILCVLKPERMRAQLAAVLYH